MTWDKVFAINFRRLSEEEYAEWEADIQDRIGEATQQELSDSVRRLSDRRAKGEFRDYCPGVGNLISEVRSANRRMREADHKAAHWKYLEHMTERLRAINASTNDVITKRDKWWAVITEPKNSNDCYYLEDLCTREFKEYARPDWFGKKEQTQ